MVKQIKIKLFIICAVIFNVFLFTGCWNYTEMDDQLNVAGIAIDKGNNGQKYHVSVEAITLGKSKEGEVKTQVIESNGNTIFEAVRKLITITSKKLFFGHTKVVIIGEDLAKEGISGILDLMVRDHEIRMSMNVIMSRGCKAKDILYTEGNDNPIVSYEIADMIETAARVGSKGLKLQIFEIFNLFHTPGKAIVIPAFETYEVEEFETFRTISNGVFKEDKLVGYLDQNDRKIYSIITDKRNRAILNLEVPGQENCFIAFEVYNATTTIRPKEIQGKLIFDVNIDMEVSIGEIDSFVNYMTKAQRYDLEWLLEDYLTQRMYTIIKKSQMQLKCDIIGFGETLHNKKPKLWEKYKDNWCETFQNVDVNIDLNIDMNGSGIARSSVKVGG